MAASAFGLEIESDLSKEPCLEVRELLLPMVVECLGARCRPDRTSLHIYKDARVKRYRIKAPSNLPPAIMWTLQEAGEVL